jgi:hypothetical protein
MGTWRISSGTHCNVGSLTNIPKLQSTTHRSYEPDGTQAPIASGPKNPAMYARAGPDQNRARLASADGIA